MARSRQVRVNEVEVWALVVWADGVLRLRLAADDLDRAGLRPGRRIPIRFSGCKDRWRSVAAVGGRPPFAWVYLDRPGRVPT